MYFGTGRLALAAGALLACCHHAAAQSRLDQTGVVKTHHNARSDSAQALPPTAVIDAGVVVGTTTRLPSATAVVNKFLGIPFAKSPPVRFGVPEKPLPFNGSLKATRQKPACIQSFLYPKPFAKLLRGLYNQPPVKESEDCLYLNVYAPSTPPPAGGRAVMFYLFGGAFQQGGASLYPGDALAAYQDVVYVVPNYRVNVFGFPNAPELPLKKRNPGLLDQRRALAWVQENIHAFGGSKDKVTIFGQSAGSFSIDALIATHKTSTAPFRAAILQSGQISYLANPGHQVPLRSNWDTLTKLLHCKSKTSNLTCVRNAPAKKLKSLASHNGILFYPNSDGLTYPTNGARHRTPPTPHNTKYARIPMLIGDVADEGTFLSQGYTNLTTFLEFYIPTNPHLFKRIKRHYNVTPRTPPARQNAVIARLRSLLQFTCGQALLANATAAAGVPVWRYWYNATFPNLRPLHGQLGVYHGSEVPLVLQTYAGGPVVDVQKRPWGLVPVDRKPTREQMELSRYMSKAWADFAKDPWKGPGWRQVGEDRRGRDVQVLGQGRAATRKLVRQEVIDRECKLLRPIFRKVTGSDVYGLRHAS